VYHTINEVRGERRTRCHQRVGRVSWGGSGEPGMCPRAKSHRGVGRVNSVVGRVRGGGWWQPQSWRHAQERMFIQWYFSKVSAPRYFWRTRGSQCFTYVRDRPTQVIVSVSLHPLGPIGSLLVGGLGRVSEFGGLGRIEVVGLIVLSRGWHGVDLCACV
jgi:hypothetical protein